MGDSSEGRGPVPIYVSGDKGYVWNADDALWLRESCGLVGAMVGGVAAFKQQNAVHGLPLELAAEEVTLAVEKHWGELKPQLGTAALANGGPGGSGARKRPWEDYEDEDYSSDDYQNQANGTAEEQEEEEVTPEWQTALAKGTHYDIPITPEDVEGTKSKPAVEGADKDKQQHTEEVEWTFPATQEQRHKYLIFKDLQSRGFCITGGSKFGADFLLYPGDPTLYHAQFCVRLMPVDVPIVPALLAAASRGSFQARKHLLIASVEEVEGGEPSVLYTTFGPVDGFG